MRKIISLILICVLAFSVMAGCSQEEPETIALKVGNYNLTTADLSYFYMDKVIEYRQSVYDQYYGYLGSYWTAMLGFDPAKPLNAQSYDESKTWADYFIDLAIKSAKDVYVLYGEAQKNDFSITGSEADSVDAMISSLTTYASYYGYTSLDDYLQMWYGATANEASYRKYYEICTTAYSYMDHYGNSQSYTQDDYRAYEKDRYYDFSVVSFDYYSLQYKSYLGEGVKDENGTTTWTDDQIQAGRDALATDIQTLIDCKITALDEFDSALQSLAVTQDADGKSTAKAMVIEKTAISGLTLSADAKNWLMDSTRIAGDFGAFPVYSYAEHADENHQHSDECGCAKYLDSCAFIRFTDRDDQLTNLVNVRHILVKFTGGTTNSDGTVTYSDVEKSAAKVVAEQLYKQWQEGEATEESFAALANAESDDQGGKVTNGGLYEMIYPNQMVEAFDAWCFDPVRKAGDTGLVMTEYGYHIMYFSSTDEMTHRDYLIDYNLRTKAVEVWYNNLMDTATHEICDLSEMAYDLKLGS